MLHKLFTAVLCIFSNYALFENAFMFIISILLLRLLIQLNSVRNQGYLMHCSLPKTHFYSILLSVHKRLLFLSRGTIII